MNRGASAAVQTEWAKSQNAPAMLARFGFDAGEGGAVCISDGYRVVTFNGDTYGAAGHLLGFSGLEESSDLRVTELTVTLSGVDQTWVSIILSKTYLGRSLQLRRLFYDAVTGNFIVDPVLLHDGAMEEPRVDEDPDAGKCVVTITSRDAFADFERRNGRHTNANDQNMWFPNDRSFDLFAQLAVLNRTFIWGGPSVGAGGGFNIAQMANNALNQARGTPFGVIGG